MPQQPNIGSSRTRFGLLPMTPRHSGERGRTATPLELFFDLVFVVAVSAAASQLHHAFAEDHILHGVVIYAIVFFGIWWAWMNFSWFATSFDNDDWLYRVLTFLQMGGVLVLAAGIKPAFSEDSFTTLILAYVVMRVAMVLQWLRASRVGGQEGRAAKLYAAGIAGVQVLWVASLLLPDEARMASILILIVAELAVPLNAERRGRTPWHPHHITERYGLFTLFVLGEGLLASANALIESISLGRDQLELMLLAVLTLVVTAGMWWVYFWPAHHHAIGKLRSSVFYGYGHYVVFAAAAAFSVGIETEISVITGEGRISPLAAEFTVTVPIAIFLVSVWLLCIRSQANTAVNIAMPAGAFVILLDPLIPVPVFVTTVVIVAIVVVLVVNPPRRVHAASGTHSS